MIKKVLKKEVFYLLLLGLIYLISRLINLTAFPVFADEAIYIRWAQFMLRDKERLFLPLMDGKPPLFMWLTALMLEIIRNPLLAGRAVSLIFGFLTLVFLYLASKNFFGKKAAFWTAIFYVSCPFFFIYNRMALIEGLLSFALCLQLYFLSLYKQTRKKYFILLSGLSWGLAMLSKTSAFFFFSLYLPWGFYFDKNKQGLKNRFRQKRVLFFLFLACLLAGLVFLINKFSPLFPSLFSRSRDFSFTLQEFFEGQYKSVHERFLMIGKWVAYYSSPGLSALFLTSLFYVFKKNKNRSTVNLLWGFVFFFGLPLVLFGKILSSRYFLPLGVPILLLAGLATARWNRLKIIKVFVLIFIFAFNLNFIFLTLQDADKTPFLENDKTFYLQEWSSGHGIRQAFDYFTQLAKNEKILVRTEGFFGTLPDGLLIYQTGYGIEDLDIIGIGVTLNSVPEELTLEAASQRVFLIGNSHRFTFSDKEPLRLVKSYPRPAGGPSLLLYEVLKQRE